MKIFRSLTVFCLIGCLAVLSGCQNGDGNETEQPTPYPYDFRCGYMLTFDDPDDENYIPPTSDDFTSDNAVACYVGREYYNDGNSSYLLIDGGLFVNNSHNEVAIVDTPLSADKSGSITMKEEIFYTSELNFKQAKLYYVCYNAEEGRLYTEDYVSVSFLDSFTGFSVSEEMQAKIINGEGELETVTYSFDLSMTFKEIDTLQEVTITEYDGSDNRISTVYESSTSLKDANYYQYKYETKSDCQYVIINKRYKKADGEIYSERTLYNRDMLAQSEVIYLPYGNGLTMPKEITISFSE